MRMKESKCDPDVKKKRKKESHVRNITYYIKCVSSLYIYMSFSYLQ